MLFKADLKRKTTLHKVENRRRATEAEETARWAAQAVKQPGAFRLAGIKMWGRLRGCPWDPRLDPVSHGGRFSHWVTPREETVPTTFVSALWAEEADGATALGPTVEWKWDRFWLCWRIIIFFQRTRGKWAPRGWDYCPFTFSVPPRRGGTVCDLTGHWCNRGRDLCHFYAEALGQWVLVDSLFCLSWDCLFGRYAMERLLPYFESQSEVSEAQPATWWTHNVIERQMWFRPFRFLESQITTWSLVFLAESEVQSGWFQHLLSGTATTWPSAP